MRAVEKLLTTKRLLAHLSRDYAPVAMYQTFCPEDIVLAHLIYSDLVHTEFKNIQMFFIDTGRTSDEMYLAIEKMQHRYGQVITVLHPDAAALEEFGAVKGFGANYYQRSIDIRFYTPLRRALKNRNAWISTGNQGHFKTQSPNRDKAWISWDHLHEIPCFNPLVRWTQDEVRNYARHHGLHLLNTVAETGAVVQKIVLEESKETLPTAVGLG